MNQVTALSPADIYEIAPTDLHESPGTRKRRTMLWLSGAFWGLHAMALWVADFLDRHPHLIKAAAVRIALTMVGLALCYGIHMVLQKLSGHAWSRKAPIIVFVSLVAAELFAWCSYFALAYAKGTPIHVAVEGSGVIRTLVPWTWFFLAWVGLYLAVEYGYDAREEERRSARLRSMAQSAKLQALHYQINPHFLFNSFNSVSALILDGRAEDANAMVERLAAFFRVNLATNPEVDISLAEEIALQTTYLGIEQVRYPDLQFCIDLPEALGRATIPAFLLQPLVENAIKHGNSGTPGVGGASITISARQQGKVLCVTVENSCPAFADERCISGTGTGLRNVRERLYSRFGTTAKLTTGWLGASGFRAVLEMPLGYIA